VLQVVCTANQFDSSITDISSDTDKGLVSVQLNLLSTTQLDPLWGNLRRTWKVVFLGSCISHDQAHMQGGSKWFGQSPLPGHDSTT